ncbi:MAG TPA: SDR family oxidoreductase [Gemmatimonadales bacterium]|nr:SDR family oxidoreductase [Gemmatimonadales bacterium]
MTTTLITGANRGIGMATAVSLARAGHRVLATMRDTASGDALRTVAAAESLAVHIAQLDVNSDASVRAAVTALESAHGPVDVLVNNAGIGRFGSVEELPLEAFRAVMETNYFGTIRCIQAVLPGMRERGQGCIVNISSVSGRLSTSPLGPYAASKFAVEALSEALAQEVLPFGIRVVVVQPGTIDTAMPRSVAEHPGHSIYPNAQRVARMFSSALRGASDPSEVGDAIRDILADPSKQFRYPVGADAEALLAMRTVISDEEWIRVIA